ncbi:hypothetical protein [Sphingobium sp. DC-2]|uniref:hypothetical protein n=1 Tax=Sphingobium sp. DC-2 TaxID=1303256 RepID=UPI0004C418F6|nr:hypothetical protein [Sphingobium sp. DC-2]
MRSGDRPERRISRLRNSRLYGATLCLLIPVAPAFSASPETGGTIGLVLTSWRPALYETPGAKEECPSGLQVSEDIQNEKTPGAAERLAKFGFPLNRGPNGELAAYAPMKVEDPIPFRELQTKNGFGLNLDGTSDGRATAKSCTHEKFRTPEGVAADNQLARVLGCTIGWRASGFNVEFAAREFASSSVNRILVEISGVDDERNDPDVEIRIYKGLDGLVATGDGKFLPGTNQRIDNRFPRYMHQTRGKIADGVLTSDPIPLANLPLLWVANPGERKFRDLQLKLKLTDMGAEGIVSGYEDLRIWWNNYSRGMNSHGGIGNYSSAQLYRAAHRHADGYPDPKTGQCTAISAAYRVEAARAMIAHPAVTQPSTVTASNDRTKP